jgi:hypothetical protein
MSVYYRRSLDNGSSWTTIVNVACDSVHDVEEIDIQTDSQNAHVVFERDDKAYFVRGTNYGASWGPCNSSPMRIDNAVQAYDPRLAVCENAIHVVFRDRHNAFYLQSIDSGSSWTTVVQVSDIVDIIRPSVACNETGVYVLGRKQPEARIAFWESMDGGVSWSVNELLGTGSFPRIDADSTQLYTTWWGSGVSFQQTRDLLDPDHDKVRDPEDNCPTIGNRDQIDTDGDGIGDACDNCPSVSNGAQNDADGDSIGDVCDDCTDTDGDSWGDPGFPANTCGLDNCPGDSNPGQLDFDGDGLGDVCDGDDDDDGLLDDFETQIGTNPLAVNTDFDGLDDTNEVCWDGNCQSYDPHPVGQDTNALIMDTDGDSVIDGPDCNPIESQVWSIPSEARELRAQVDQTYYWLPPAVPGAISLRYDVIGSADPSNFVDGAWCVESDGTDTSASDPNVPLIGGVFFYIVRAENACGHGLDRVAKQCP